MCGIVGLLALRDGPPPCAEEVRAMAGTLVHRGPDADGFFVAGRAALGFRRLSVVDLHTGHQPAFGEDGSVAVFQNGEIYNFRELRGELEAKGHTFRSRGDTEAIAHLYEEEGERFVERLRGMFAIALYDRRRERLLLARDRLGKKPLYYAEVGDRLLYGSELKALLSLPSFPRAVDEQALLDFFCYRAVQAPKSIFRAARKLPPGHLLIADAAGARRPRPYWRLSFAEPFEEPAERLVERLRELLSESVQARLTADVPLGAFLSGGVDSSAVVAAMRAGGARPARTFCVGFDDGQHDERRYAAGVARALGTAHTEALVPLEPGVALEVLPWHFDEPFADSSAVPTYAVAKLARQHVTVALSGDGGDELFAGYQHYFFSYLVGCLREAIPEALRPLLGAVSRVYPRRSWMPRYLRAKTVLAATAEDPAQLYARSVRTNDPAFVLRYLGGDLRARLRGYDPTVVIEDAYRRADAPDTLGRMLQTDLATYLPDDILTKVDRASMAASLEVRCPLLDHRLVEFVARIPSGLKIRRGERKWIFRRALAGAVPRSALRRPKQGFSVPLAAWTRRDLREAIDQAISEAPPGLFDRAALDQSWQAHLVGAADHAEFFWALLVLDRWRRAHAAPLP